MDASIYGTRTANIVDHIFALLVEAGLTDESRRSERYNLLYLIFRAGEYMDGVQFWSRALDFALGFISEPILNEKGRHHVERDAKQHQALLEIAIFSQVERPGELLAFLKSHPRLAPDSGKEADEREILLGPMLVALLSSWKRCRSWDFGPFPEFRAHIPQLLGTLMTGFPSDGRHNFLLDPSVSGRLSNLWSEFFSWSFDAENRAKRTRELLTFFKDSKNDSSLARQMLHAAFGKVDTVQAAELLTGWVDKNKGHN